MTVNLDRHSRDNTKSTRPLVSQQNMVQPKLNYLHEDRQKSQEVITLPPTDDAVAVVQTLPPKNKLLADVVGGSARASITNGAGVVVGMGAGTGASVMVAGMGTTAGASVVGKRGASIVGGAIGANTGAATGTVSAEHSNSIAGQASPTPVSRRSALTSHIMYAKPSSAQALPPQGHVTSASQAATATTSWQSPLKILGSTATLS